MAIGLLKTENEIIVTFPDAGGRISSLILNVEEYKTPSEVISFFEPNKDTSSKFF